MFTQWKYRAFIQAGTLAFLCYLAWLGWMHLGPRKPEVGPLRKQVADLIIPKVVEDLRAARTNIQSVALLHLVNDPSDYVTDQLRSGIERSGIVDLRDRTVMEKARNLLQLRHPSFNTIGPAVKQGKRMGVQAVVFGQVNSFETSHGDAKIDMDILFAPVDGSGELYKNYKQQVSAGILSNAAVQERMLSVRPAQRFFGWVLIVLLLPVFTIAFIRAMVRKESNKVNAFTLTVYTLVDALFAWLLLGASITGWFSVLQFLVAVGAALAYNFYIMNFALKLEE